MENDAFADTTLWLVITFKSKNLTLVSELNMD